MCIKVALLIFKLLLTCKICKYSDQSGQTNGGFIMLAAYEFVSS